MIFKGFVVLLVVMMVAYSQGMYHWQTKTVSDTENHLVFPGTKWCGKGNNAMSYDDLGQHNLTDRCCRRHDHCPTYIPPFKRRYGLLNFHAMQMSHCSCESKLFDCLWKLNGNPISTAVGKLYFNVLRNPCFELVESSVCVKWKFDWWNLNYYCTKYGMQLKAKKLWLKNYLRRFPNEINRYFTTTTTATTSPDTTRTQRTQVTTGRTIDDNTASALNLSTLVNPTTASRQRTVNVTANETSSPNQPASVIQVDLKQRNKNED